MHLLLNSIDADMKSEIGSSKEGLRHYPLRFQAEVASADAKLIQHGPEGLPTIVGIQYLPSQLQGLQHMPQCPVWLEINRKVLNWSVQKDHNLSLFDWNEVGHKRIAQFKVLVNKHKNASFKSENFVNIQWRFSEVWIKSTVTLANKRSKSYFIKEGIRYHRLK